jgi:hypothetical protein
MNESRDLDQAMVQLYREIHAQWQSVPFTRGGHFSCDDAGGYPFRGVFKTMNCLLEMARDRIEMAALRAALKNERFS